MPITKFTPGGDHVGCPVSCGACVGQVCVNVKDDCTSANIAGATVTLKLHSTGATIGSGVTDASGNLCISITADDYYDLTVSSGSCNTYVATNQHYTCTTTNLNIRLRCAPSSNSCVVFTIKGCGSLALPGATITVSGIDSGSGTTNSSGQWTFCTLNSGTLNYTISGPGVRFVSQSSSIAITGGTCGGNLTVNATLSAASGYTCCSPVSANTPFPVTTTMTITDDLQTATVGNIACGGNGCMPAASMDHCWIGATTTPCVHETVGSLPSNYLATSSVEYRYSVAWTGSSPTITTSSMINTSLPFHTPCLSSCVAGCPTGSGHRIYGRDTWTSCSAGGQTDFAPLTGTVSSWYPLTISATYDTSSDWQYTVSPPDPNAGPNPASASVTIYDNAPL